ncbi:MarC family protein [uncultured Muribaculum sp.]|uniref:MarC family protein n=1 Tax=uncultured Muribaculum sp. TaxID=1918613 RepID=UPI00259709B0|nr:MarC family protein [uncultured Muribaculum sp.]
MDNLLPFAFICLTSFFTLTNPLGTMPVLLSMTKGMDYDQRNQIVKRATVISFIILIGFTVCGQILFSLFGISANGFRIAAGIIIMKIGYDMLHAQYSNTKLKDEEVKVYANDISITPLSIPMLCGPGAIANGIMLMEDANTWQMKLTLILSIAVIYLVTYLILRASTKLVGILGETGNNVMMRLMGLILMVIAVECFVGGLRPIMVDIIKAGNGLL